MITSQTPRAVPQRLAIIGSMAVIDRDGLLYTHGSFGRVIGELARRYANITLAVPQARQVSSLYDYPLPSNVMVRPLPPATTALDALLNWRAAARVYQEVIVDTDHVFIRGVLTPAVGVVYRQCARLDKPVLHWIPGNPMALLRSHRRNGLLKDTLSRAFVWQWERRLHRGHRRARAAYLCNGGEIAARHRSPNCHITVSTTLEEEDLFEREDTCTSDPVQILCLCFIRPEKGIEYLIEAFAQLKTSRRTELVLVGGRNRYPAYQAKLNRLVEELGLVGRVIWRGHVESSVALKEMRAADIFAFPSLSEGTPRVLVEARANCLPVVATSIGGIPDSVQNGEDGLLVPAKDSVAMARSIDRVIADGELRRNMIANGFKRVRSMTIQRFGEEVEQILHGLQSRGDDE